MHGDTAHTRPCRLDFRGDDRHLLADQRIHQRRLARIGRPDQRNKTGTRLLIFIRHDICASISWRPPVLPAALMCRQPRLSGRQN